METSARPMWKLHRKWRRVRSDSSTKAIHKWFKCSWGFWKLELQGLEIVGYQNLTHKVIKRIRGVVIMVNKTRRLGIRKFWDKFTFVYEHHRTSQIWYNVSNQTIHDSAILDNANTKIHRYICVIISDTVLGLFKKTSCSVICNATLL